MSATSKAERAVLIRAKAIDYGGQFTEVTDRDRAMARGLMRLAWLERRIGCLYVAVLTAVAGLIVLPAIEALLRGTQR